MNFLLLGLALIVIILLVNPTLWKKPKHGEGYLPGRFETGVSDLPQPVAGVSNFIEPEMDNARRAQELILANGGVPVPAGSLKESNEETYKAPWYAMYYGTRPVVKNITPTGGVVVTSPFIWGPNVNIGTDYAYQYTTAMYGGDNPVDKFPYRHQPPLNTTDDYLHPGDGNFVKLDNPPSTVRNDPLFGAGDAALMMVPPGTQQTPRWYGSVSAFAPLPEINTPWEKIGVVTPITNPENLILTLFRRLIAPMRDMFAYSVQDKDGNVIPLSNNVTYLVTGDELPASAIVGYESKGPFKVKSFVDNKWVIA